MTGMALDSIQRTTWTILTTSLTKKGSQKSSFSDVFSLETSPNSSANDPNPVMTPPVKSGFFNDTLHEENPPPNPRSPLIMTNKQVLNKLYDLQLKAHRWEKEECYRLQRIFGTIKRPMETQCASLVSKPALYHTRWDITSATIRVQWEAYLAYPLADSTSPLCVLICQESFFHPYSKNETKQRTHAHNVDIAHLSLSSFLDSYKSQVQKMKFDQIFRNNCFRVMTQLSKTLCYCNKMSTNIISSLRPMPNFQPHKKKIMATVSPPKVTPPKQQQPKVPPKPVNAYAYPKIIRVVNWEVCHLYSLKYLIEEDFVNIYYPFDLFTCLGHQYYTKLYWIQNTRHHIYISFNEEKRYLTHPVWSNFNEQSKCKRLCLSIPQYYAW